MAQSPGLGERCMASDAALVGVMASMSPAQLRALLAGGAERTAPWLLAAAECGLAEAQLCLGRMRLVGQGGPRDEARAFYWFSRAARSGNVDAWNMLGRCHEHGWGAPADFAAAARWFAKAARTGDAWAQYNLAHLYLNGRGVRRDARRAFAWYQRAADKGHVRAMNLVGRCLEQGWGVGSDPAAAGDWYRRSAEGGYFRGQFNYASLLAAEGRLDEAMEWFSKALAEAPAESRAVMALALRRDSHAELRALAASPVV